MPNLDSGQKGVGTGMIMAVYSWPSVFPRAAGAFTVLHVCTNNVFLSPPNPLLPPEVPDITSGSISTDPSAGRLPSRDKRRPRA